MKLEYRKQTFEPLKLEVRDDGTKAISGYAAVFNSDSVDFGYFVERIRPGAFSKSLRDNPDVVALLSHDTGQPIGRTSAGNLKLIEDERGLRFELSPIDTEDGRKAIEWVRSGVVNQMSFGFMPEEDSWSTKNGKNLRELISVRLYEVSLVTFPAYPDTEASMRSFKDIGESGRLLIEKMEKNKAETRRAKSFIKLHSLKNK